MTILIDNLEILTMLSIIVFIFWGTLQSKIEVDAYGGAQVNFYNGDGVILSMKYLNFLKQKN